MALPLAIPDSPVSSPDASSNGPTTPVSPSNSVQTLALPPPVDGAAPAQSTSPANAAQPKRKPSRRANTAERRATHNAVERARRETLNSRFLDLAALLPNLSQIRRPSKSSIVNSSIAHIHASRRHRLLAARELRLLKLESDALRRELNEWRDRSGLPRCDEPVRGEAFQMILSGEVEVLSPSIIDEDGAEGDYDDDGYDNDYPINDGPMDPAPLLAKAAPDVGNPFAHNVPQQQQQQQRGGLQLQTILPRPATHGPQTPMIVQSPTNVSFENPAMAAMYEPHAHPQMHQQFAGQYMHPAHAVHDDKAAWGAAAQMFGAQVGGGGALFTPPASSHGNVSPMNVPASQQQQQAYFMSLQRQQLLQQQQQQQQQQRMDEGAPSGRRERSGSVNSNGSGYASPASNAGSYEMPGVMGGPGGAPRRGGAPGWDDAMGVGMGMGGMPGMGMMKSAAISVGGGGNGHGYAAMML
ncbi:hypothetical protein K466DRAFT_483529 [Polyporus arcularius HHB13444]|uniref:BHLH domain-containing protein n=1 Tax=Polyporus arcularius HHB13444 TaxID=1314778 RepID=A0A5C3PP48_9APHY|nr:hypothetical protein K466DRAFT_483529 [Polyporus arcularius HHB13444]